MSAYDNLVKAGARFLDTHPDVPTGWRGQINISKLAMSRGSSCVIGQLQAAHERHTTRDQIGRYHRGLDRLGIEPNVQAYELGFNGSTSQCPQLTEAWKHYLLNSATAEVVDSINDAEKIVSLLDGLTLKQLRANQKVINKAYIDLKASLTL